jgi:hypothetical protein
MASPQNSHLGKTLYIFTKDYILNSPGNSLTTSRGSQKGKVGDAAKAVTQRFQSLEDTIRTYTSYSPRAILIR